MPIPMDSLNPTATIVAGTHIRIPKMHVPVLTHTHHRGAAASPNSPPRSPLMHTTTGASAASQSTAGTAATNTTNGTPATAGGGTGSWGRVARTVDWVRGAGVHPPFAFESAASSTASANGDRRGGSGGNGSASGSDIRERERDRDRERSRRHVAHPLAPPTVPASPGRALAVVARRALVPVPARAGGSSARSSWSCRCSSGTAADNNDARAQALMREREMEKRVREREGARRTRERLAEYELGYARERSGKDKEVTGRFREVLGGEARAQIRRGNYSLEGSSGLLGHVERLLDKAPTRHVSTSEKRELLDDLVRIVRENEW
ncbi:hypothetical protein BGW80DRAFT_1460601 [Lactifluus volemus]|nr:hypothetical protein BGW80DRAFT_1460601 [Lactifluus volemus]